MKLIKKLDDRAQTAAITVVLGTVISVIMAIIIGAQFLDVGGSMLVNNTDGTSALENAESIFYVVIGIVILVPLAYVGRMFMGMFGGK